MSRRNLNRIAISLIVVFAATAAGVGATYSFFWDQQDIEGSFFATSFSQALQLSPGKSKATRRTRKPPSQLIAQTSADGQIALLDFGEIPKGNTNNSTDVMRIKNIWSDTLTIELNLSPEIEGLFWAVQLEKRVNKKNIFGNPLEIEPGAEAVVVAKLAISSKTLVAHYLGDLIVSGAFTKKIRVLVTVK